MKETFCTEKEEGEGYPAKRAARRRNRRRRRGLARDGGTPTRKRAIITGLGPLAGGHVQSRFVQTPRLPFREDPTGQRTLSHAKRPIMTGGLAAPGQVQSRLVQKPLNGRL